MYDDEQPDASTPEPPSAYDRLTGPVPYLALVEDEPRRPAQPAPGQLRTSEAGWLRLVIVVWCFWLLGAWAMAWVSDTSVPRVRWMLFAGSFGLMIVWPAFRLSERNRGAGGSRGGPGGDDDVGAASPVLLDWLGLILVYQAVIWSLHLMALWPLARGLWLDAAVVSWSLLSALIVAVARRWPGALARTVGMALCIALVFAEPVAIWAATLAGYDAWSMRVSPIQALWELTQPPTLGAISPWDQRTMLVGMTAIAGWAVLGCWTLGERLVKK